MEYSLLPKFLQVELTYKCNSRCSFCYNPHHKSSPAKYSAEEILESIDEYRLPHVQLIGGEVTTIKNLPELLDGLKQTRWKSIVTNGRVFRGDIRGKVDEIYLSLHGDTSTHETLTQEFGSFEPIVKNIEKYVSWGIDINSDTVLTKFNADQMGEIALHAKSLGMKRIFVNIFQPEGLGSLRPDFSPSIQQIRSAIDQLLEVRKATEFEVYFGTSTPFCLDSRLISEKMAFRCGAGEWFASVDPSGELRICNHSTRSYGNVVNRPLNEIWHSKLINTEYRNKRIDDTICQHCPFQSDCLGGCRINEKGNYRVDPLVSRDRDDLLSPSEMASLKGVYDSNPFPLTIK